MAGESFKSGSRISQFCLIGKRGLRVFASPSVSYFKGDQLSKIVSLTISANKRFGGLKSKSGFPGVSFHKASGKWTAPVMLSNGKRKHIGLYPTAQEASDARVTFIAMHGTADPQPKAATVTTGEGA